MLTPTEAYLWQCARSWRQPAPPPDPAAVDWDRLVHLGLHNRMQTLLAGVMTATEMWPTLPAAAARALRAGRHRYVANARHLAQALRAYLQHAAHIDQKVVVIKGLWLSHKIYGQAGMRPGGDIDLLLHRQDIPAALRILESQMGYGRWWRPLLDDAYYYRHHLHQQRCNHDRSIWVEPHWLLDHPYSRLTVDYEAMMDRSTPGRLLGEPIQELSPPDLLLSLAIHLVKHAVYLPAVLSRPDLERLILADGMLMYFVDVAEVLRRHQSDLQWSQVVALARAGGAVEMLGAVLAVCRRSLQAPVPDWVLAALPAGPPDRFAGWLMNRIADHEVAAHDGQAGGGAWAFLLGYQETAIFRPVRLLDFAYYLLPGPAYLRRRYRRAGLAVAGWHLGRALVQYARILLDTVYYTLKRRREVALLDRQGFRWPMLPGEEEAA